MDALTFQTEVRRLESLMYRVGWSYLGNDDDTLDAVQEALAKAWEKRASLRESRQFKPWVMRILVNQCKDMLRRRKRFSFHPLEEETVAVAMPEEAVPVWEAVEKLPPQQRVLILLYYADGFSVKEISEALGLPAGTVKTRMRSARKRLSRTLLVEWEESV